MRGLFCERETNCSRVKGEFVATLFSIRGRRNDETLVGDGMSVIVKS